MPKQSTGLNDLFKALGNPTRLAIVDRLSDGPAPVTELAAPFAMALPSFLQHLDVLEEVGLVRSEKTGRVRTYRLVPRPLTQVEKWIAERKAEWETRLNQLDTYLQQMDDETNA